MGIYIPPDGGYFDERDIEPLITELIKGATTKSKYSCIEKHKKQCTFCNGTGRRYKYQELRVALFNFIYSMDKPLYPC